MSIPLPEVGIVAPVGSQVHGQTLKSSPILLSPYHGQKSTIITTSV